MKHDMQFPEFSLQAKCQNSKTVSSTGWMLLLWGCLQINKIKIKTDSDNEMNCRTKALSSRSQMLTLH